MVGLHDTVGSVRPRRDNKAVQYSLSYERVEALSGDQLGRHRHSQSHFLGCMTAKGGWLWVGLAIRRLLSKGAVPHTADHPERTKRTFDTERLDHAGMLIAMLHTASYI
jgi:hypothetical protein